MKDGNIVKTAGLELAHFVEENGYDSINDVTEDGYDE